MSVKRFDRTIPILPYGGRDGRGPYGYVFPGPGREGFAVGSTHPGGVRRYVNTPRRVK